MQVRFSRSKKQARSEKESRRRSVFSTFDRSLLMLFILNIGVSLSMESVNALFPLYIQSLGASILEVGLLLSAAGLVSTIIMLPSGWMSDRLGRRLTLILSVALAIFPPFFYTFATNWQQLIPWTIIYTISFAVFIPARMVYIADSTSSDDRAKIYGYMNLAWPIGSLVGPTVAGFLAKLGGFHYPFYFATLVSLFTLLPAFLLVEKRVPKSPAPAAEGSRTRNAGFSRESVYLLTLLTIYQFFVSAGIGTTYSLLSIYLSEVFHVDKLNIGLFFSLIGLSLFVSQLVGGWASTRFGLKRTMEMCLLIISPLFIVCAIAPTYELFTLTYVALYGIYGATWPAAVTILMSLVDKSKWGLATGIRQAGVRLGFTVGPALGGALWEAYGATTSFYASAALIAISIPFLVRLKEE